MKDAKAKRTAAKETKNKNVEAKKKLLSVKEKPNKKQAKPKAVKDPNQPKRPPTAFFVYLEEFRKTFKQKHPDVKGVTAVGKACGDKWKEMSEAEKAPYIAKAAQKRAEYDVTMKAYKKKQVSKVPHLRNLKNQSLSSMKMMRTTKVGRTMMMNNRTLC